VVGARGWANEWPLDRSAVGGWPDSGSPAGGRGAAAVEKRERERDGSFIAAAMNHASARAHADLRRRRRQREWGGGGGGSDTAARHPEVRPSGAMCAATSFHFSKIKPAAALTHCLVRQPPPSRGFPTFILWRNHGPGSRGEGLGGRWRGRRGWPRGRELNRVESGAEGPGGCAKESLPRFGNISPREGYAPRI
jgi:hypothetical protein